MLTWTTAITHTVFVLFEFHHETTLHKFNVSLVKSYICNVFAHINVFEIIILY